MNRMITTAMLNNGIHSSNGHKNQVEKFYEPPAVFLNNNTDMMAQIQAQNVLSAVHHQFHHNQGKYIDLLSNIVEYQATLLEKYQNSPVLSDLTQNLEQILQILQINQSHYNANHEGYLQNQLALTQGVEFPTNVSKMLNHAPASQVTNYPLAETETTLSTLKKEEQKSIDVLASSKPTSATSATPPKITPTLQAVAITSEGVSHPLKSASSTPTFATTVTSPKVTSALEQVVTIPETINHSVKETYSTNVPNTAPVATEVNTQSANSVDTNKVSNRLLEVVSDKTGYPIDMLDMDMDLEADLGIDSIKQIQIFAAIQDEFPDLVLDTEEIAELRTLAKIVDYLKEYSSGDQTTQPSDNLDHQAAIERQLVKKNV